MENVRVLVAISTAVIAAVLMVFDFVPLVVHVFLLLFPPIFIFSDMVSYVIPYFTALG